MTITFIRIDDRVIHGQITTRWMRDFPCDGLVVVNDHIALDPIMKSVYKSATEKKTFIWTSTEWIDKRNQVLASPSKYFLITKNIQDMRRILIDEAFDPGIRTILLGPTIRHEDSKSLGNGAFHITPKDAADLELLFQNGSKLPLPG
jgi:mannose/fructose/N-acetylgalactosamine-specific phosphotransferase system component IIB